MGCGVPFSPQSRGATDQLGDIARAENWRNPGGKKGSHPFLGVSSLGHHGRVRGPFPSRASLLSHSPFRGCSFVPPPILPKDLTRDMRGFFYSLLAAASRVPIGPQLGGWGATEQKARLSRGPHACQARFRRNPLENPLYPHSDRMKCRKHGPFLAARTMNPSVNFPKSKLNGSVQLLVRPQNLNYEARTFSWWGQRIRSRPTNRYATQF
jgi:hypothetical protein